MTVAAAWLPRLGGLFFVPPVNDNDLTFELEKGIFAASLLFNIAPEKLTAEARRSNRWGDFTGMSIYDLRTSAKGWVGHFRMFLVDCPERNHPRLVKINGGAAVQRAKETRDG